MKDINQIIDRIKAVSDEKSSTDCIGMNEIEDFITLGGNKLNEDVEDYLIDAINSRINSVLENYPGNRNEAWEAWCNEDITADFSDLQEIVDQIDKN